MASSGYTGFARTLVIGFLAVGLRAGPALALGVIETPAAGTTETGIGVISGWHCEGDLIQVQIDDGELMTAGSKTPRGDTFSTCGRTDTGYSLLYNFNLLDGSQDHRIVAYADGVEFASTQFRTTRLGEGFLRGLQGTCEILNFPDLGRTTTMRWSEARQNFSITSTREDPEPAPGVHPFSGTYYGARKYNFTCEDLGVTPATFEVHITETTFTLRTQGFLGEDCDFSGLWTLESDGTIFVSGGTATGTCFTPSFFFAIRVDGQSLYAEELDLCGVILTGAKFR